MELTPTYYITHIINYLVVYITYYYYDDQITQFKYKLSKTLLVDGLEILYFSIIYPMDRYLLYRLPKIVSNYSTRYNLQTCPDVIFSSCDSPTIPTLRLWDVSRPQTSHRYYDDDIIIYPVRKKQIHLAGRTSRNVSL